MTLRHTLTILIIFCALHSGAQNLSSAYVALADSADRYIRSERWAEAEEAIIKALREEPANKSNYILWTNLGIVRANRENHAGAMQAYDIGLTSAPRSTMLLTNRAYSLTALGLKTKALEDLDLALATDSTLSRARKMRGLLLLNEGKLENALRDFDIYERDNGEDASIQEARGDISTLHGDKEGTLHHYRRARQLNPDEQTTLKLLKGAFLTGQIEKVEAELSEALKEYPRNGDLYLLRAALNKTRYQNDAVESDLATARAYGADPVLTSLIDPSLSHKK